MRSAFLRAFLVASTAIALEKVARGGINSRCSNAPVADHERQPMIADSGPRRSATDRARRAESVSAACGGGGRRT
jgi:hypothetical protein